MKQLLALIPLLLLFGCFAKPVVIEFDSFKDKCLTTNGDWFLATTDAELSYCYCDLTGESIIYKFFKYEGWDGCVIDSTGDNSIIKQSLIDGTY